MTDDGEKMTVFFSTTDDLLVDHAVQVSGEEYVRTVVMDSISSKTGRTDIEKALLQLIVNLGGCVKDLEKTARCPDHHHITIRRVSCAL